MPALVITRNYADTLDYTEAIVDAQNDSIEAWANTTKLDQDNIQTGGIATANLADGSVTAVKLGAESVTNAKLGADAVNGSKIADDSIDSEHIVDGSIDPAHLADSAVETAKIDDGAVTWGKLSTTDRAVGTTAAAGGVAISDSSGTFSTAATSFTDVTNLSVELVTVGRPVHLMLVSAETGSTAVLDGGFVQVNQSVSVLRFLNGSTALADLNIGAASTGAVTSYMPASMFQHVAAPAAGTHTFKVQVTGFSGTVITTVKDCKLVAYEL